jgi:uncharacterized protein YijF (DUF1287 family)
LNADADDVDLWRHHTKLQDAQIRALRAQNAELQNALNADADDVDLWRQHTKLQDVQIHALQAQNAKLQNALNADAEKRSSINHK